MKEVVLFNHVVFIESFVDGGINTTDSIPQWLDNSNGDKIASTIFKIESINEFKEILNFVERETLNGLKPIIHIEMHGIYEGLVLKDESIFNWRDLFDQLRAINIKCNLNLCIMMGACFSSELLLQLQSLDQPAPFLALFFGVEKVFTPELLQTYEVFYNALFEESDFNQIQRRVLEKCKENNFPNLALITSYGLFAGIWIEFLKRNKAQMKHNFIRRASELKSFAKHKRVFFLLDQYPENAERFDISLSMLRNSKESLWEEGGVIIKKGMKIEFK